MGVPKDKEMPNPILNAILFGIGLGIGWVTCWWLMRQKQPPLQIHWMIGSRQKIFPEGVDFMAELQAGETATFGVKITDAYGNKAEVQSPSWSADPEDILTIEKSEPAVSPAPEPQPPDPNAPHPAHPISGVGQKSASKGPLKIEKGAKDVNTMYYATVKATGKSGGAVLTFKADADMGEGVKELIGTALITVASGEATVIELEQIEAPTRKSKK